MRVEGKSTGRVLELATKAAGFFAKWKELKKLTAKEENVAGSFLDNLMIEFIRFMVLKAYVQDVDAKLLSPTFEIDRIWHRMLQFPVEYAQLCDLLLPASVPAPRLINHNPMAAYTAPKAKEKRLERFLSVYKQEFGESLDEEDETAEAEKPQQKPKPRKKLVVVRKVIQSACGRKPGFKC
jgi:hypothetical protein